MKSIDKLFLELCACLLLFAAGCSKEDPVAVEPPETTDYRYTMLTTNICTLLPLEASSKFDEVDRVTWDVINAPSDLYRLADTDTKTPIFIAVEKGDYQLRASAGEIADTVFITVSQDSTTFSPYTAKVFDFLPAPGQFVNKLPSYEEGDTHEDMLEKVRQNLIGDEAYMVSLGGWGGYVVFGFDHTIVNVSNRRDFRIEGNAFAAAANPNPDAPYGGSCELGIIMVAYDKNSNGVPDDDEWYEIKGSGNFTAENEAWYTNAVDNGNDVETIRDYQKTYYRPETEDSLLRWTNNQGQEGYKEKSYYPGWISDDEITYKGIRLANNSIDESGGKGTYYVLYAFKYGYADNLLNTDDGSAIDIDWAIDEGGNKADLPGIDFVKVYSGIDQENGWLGEASTEVGGSQDLHLLGINIETIDID